MAYTVYRTWTTGEIVTAALMNEQVKDNGLLTAPAIMTTAGDIIYASAANTPARLAKSTTSTQYLANTGTSNVPQWNEVALDTGVSGTLPVGNGGTGITSLGSNVATFLGTPSSANLRSALTDETGSGAAVFATSPTLVTPALGTPSSGTLTSCTGLPEAGLAVSNGPTNGYMLTAQSGDAGGMTWAAAASGPSQANQTAIEAETNQDTYVPPDLMKHHPGIAKAWGSTVADGTKNTNDYNIASVTDNGTGDRLFVIGDDFSSADYVVVASGGNEAGVAARVQNPSAGSSQILIHADGGADGTHELVDLATYMVAFGDQ